MVEKRRRLKIVHVSYSDSQGGAARAALRLHQSLSFNDIDSKMFVSNKKTDLESVFIYRSPTFLNIGLDRFKQALASRVVKFQKTENRILRSPNCFSTVYLNKNSISQEADLLHLHWLGGETLSIKDIGDIKKPCVWTMHDMWAFCGAEHYAVGLDDSRFKDGYTKTTRPQSHYGFDIDRFVWRKKKKYWKKPIHLIAPTRWMYECVKESELLHNWPVTVIPNTVDTEKYKSWPKEPARDILGLPQDKKIILFGAIGGSQDPRKGWDLLCTALNGLKLDPQKYACAIFGQSEPASPTGLKLPQFWLGRIYDDVTLALTYSAADLVVVPSRMEAFGQVASEAQSCGRPVVAFDCTGLKDVVEHKKTGFLAKPYDAASIGKGIQWIFEDAERYLGLCDQARARAMSLWNMKTIAQKHKELYLQILHTAIRKDN